MSKSADRLNLYISSLKEKVGLKKIDKALLTSIMEELGPSQYDADASKVACSSKKELSKVKADFLIKRLGLKDDKTLDEAIKEVCQSFGKGNRNKYRAVFHYLLVQKFEKEHLFADAAESKKTQRKSDKKKKSKTPPIINNEEIIRKHALYA